jgi:hypothetical protein
MIDIIFNEEGSKWNSTIKNMEHYDFYFFNSYQPEGEKSILINFEEDGYSISLPLIIRPIENTTYYDATSVYGYGGPLCSNESIPERIIKKFNTSIKKCFKDLKIVSVFSRLHPLMKQQDHFLNVGNVVSLGETISIDLTLSLEEQRSQYRRRLKSRLNKLKRSDLYVFEDSNFEHIDEFVKLYHETMYRVGADSSYFFDKDYFKKLFLSDDIDAKLYFVKDGEKFISAGIFTFTDGIIEYHLSGTKTEFLKKSPLELLIDHVRILGTEQGYTNLHLGGGVGSKEDNLFHYKAGFSKSRNTFKIWKYIANKKIYQSLINKVDINKSDNFFPLYRSKNLQLVS